MIPPWTHQSASHPFTLWRLTTKNHSISPADRFDFTTNVPAMKVTLQLRQIPHLPQRDTPTSLQLQSWSGSVTFRGSRSLWWSCSITFRDMRSIWWIIPWLKKSLTELCLDWTIPSWLNYSGLNYSVSELLIYFMSDWTSHWLNFWSVSLVVKLGTSESCSKLPLINWTKETCKLPIVWPPSKKGQNPGLWRWVGTVEEERPKLETSCLQGILNSDLGALTHTLQVITRPNTIKSW